MKKVEIIIKDTHRGLRYEDGVLAKVLEAGRYEIPSRDRLFGPKGAMVELVPTVAFLEERPTLGPTIGRKRTGFRTLERA